MRKFLRTTIVALMLYTPVIVAPMALNGCAIFASDPVGASLFTMRDAYESSIRTAGRLYAQGLISEPELRRVRDAGNKFHVGYQAAVVANEQRKMEPGDARLVNLRAALDALEKIVLALSTVKN